MSNFCSLISILFFIMAVVKLVFVEQRVMNIEEIIMSAILYILFALYQQNEETKS